MLPDHELMSAWPSQAIDMSEALRRKNAAEPFPSPALAAGNSKACSQDIQHLILIQHSSTRCCTPVCGI